MSIVSHTRVDENGDTIVTDRRRDYTVVHNYTGSFERVSGLTSYLRINTPTGYWDSRTRNHFWYITDRLGSVTAVVDTAGNVVQRTGYYPSGTPYILPPDLDRAETAGEAPTLTPASDKLHIGNIWVSHCGLNWYDNTARMHDPILMRFTTPDPLYGKYPDLSPWSHCAANPINVIDVYGDSIQVAELYQKVASEAFSMIFKEKSNRFSFSSNGMIVFNGDKSGMNRKQKKLISILSDMLNSATEHTIVHFGSQMSIFDSDGNEHIVNASIGRGALAITISDNPKITENHILVNPCVESFLVYELIDSKSGLAANFRPAFIKTNVADLLFHELGEVIYQQDPFGSAKALDFNNIARELLKLRKRKYDEEHNYIPK